MVSPVSDADCDFATSSDMLRIFNERFKDPSVSKDRELIKFRVLIIAKQTDLRENRLKLKCSWQQSEVSGMKII
jgi:hypothetical protein